MIPFWVKTADGDVHTMVALTLRAAPKAMMFSEQIKWYEDNFGSAVDWVAVDTLDNIVWRKP